MGNLEVTLEKIPLSDLSLSLDNQFFPLFLLMMVMRIIKSHLLRALPINFP